MELSPVGLSSLNCRELGAAPLTIPLRRVVHRAAFMALEGLVTLRTSLRLELDGVVLGDVRCQWVLRVAGFGGADSLEQRICVTVFAKIALSPLIDPIQQCLRQIGRAFELLLRRLLARRLAAT